MENQRQLLRDVFGESSDSDEDEPKIVDVDADDDDKLCNLCSSLPIHSQSTDAERGFLPPPSVSNPKPNPNPNPSWCWQWQRIEAINGLWLCTDFLSPLQQSSLLSAIQNEGWFTELSHNQAMRFGDLPFWAVELSDCIREAVCAGDGETNNGVLKRGNETCILPSQLLWRDPFFDQLIVNMYQPGEGICAHVDLMRFEDGIAIVSLESPCIMHFSPVQEDGQEVAQEMKVPVYLNPGSLVIMWGDARYCWKHEINRKPGFQVWHGQDIDQKRRTSITLRKLCISE